MTYQRKGLCQLNARRQEMKPSRSSSSDQPIIAWGNDQFVSSSPKLVCQKLSKISPAAPSITVAPPRMKSGPGTGKRISGTENPGPKARRIDGREGHHADDEAHHRAGSVDEDVWRREEAVEGMRQVPVAIPRAADDRRDRRQPEGQPEQAQRGSRRDGWGAGVRWCIHGESRQFDAHAGQDTDSSSTPSHRHDARYCHVTGNWLMFS